MKVFVESVSLIALLLRVRSVVIVFKCENDGKLYEIITSLMLCIDNKVYKVLLYCNSWSTIDAWRLLHIFAFRKT